MHKDICQYFDNHDYKYVNGSPVTWGNCDIDNAFCCLPKPCNENQIKQIREGKRFKPVKSR